MTNREGYEQKEQQYQKQILDTLRNNGEMDAFKLQEEVAYQFSFWVRLEKMNQEGSIIYDPFINDTVSLPKEKMTHDQLVKIFESLFA